MRRKLLAALLAAGVVLGYGHALVSFVHHHHGHHDHGWDHRPPCHRDAPPPAP